MNARNFAPINVGKVAPMPSRPVPPPSLEFARALPCYEGMDDTAEWAQSNVIPSDTSNAVDKLYEQGGLSETAHEELTRLEEHYARQRLMSQRPASTPNGKHFAIAMDACAALFEIVKTVRGQDNFDQFSQVDVDKWAAICARMGYRS